MRVMSAVIREPKKAKKDWRTDRFKPGETCLKSGQYTLTDGTQATIVKGEVFPPTPRKGMGWKLTDASRGRRE